MIGNDDNFHAVGELEVGDFHIQGAGGKDDEEDQGKLQGCYLDGAHGSTFPVICSGPEDGGERPARPMRFL